MPNTERSSRGQMFITNGEMKLISKREYDAVFPVLLLITVVIGSNSSSSSTHSRRNPRSTSQFYQINANVVFYSHISLLRNFQVQPFQPCLYVSIVTLPLARSLLDVACVSILKLEIYFFWTRNFSSLNMPGGKRCIHPS